MTDAEALVLIRGYAIRQSRRDFLTSGASGIGLLALASLLRDEGLLAAEVKSSAPAAVHPLAPRARFDLDPCVQEVGRVGQDELALAAWEQLREQRLERPLTATTTDLPEGTLQLIALSPERYAAHRRGSHRACQAGPRRSRVRVTRSPSCAASVRGSPTSRCPVA